MPISKAELDAMDDLLSKGKKIADLAKKYPKYDYWEIYWAVSDRSFMGKKRSLTNRINRLVRESSTSARETTAAEAKQILEELYKQLKKNSAMLIEIDRILRGAK